MHTDNGAIKAVGIFLHLFFHKIEVGHRARVVVLDGVCVQTHKLNAARNKTEVGIAKNNLVGLVTRAQTVVITQQGNKGYIERFQQVAAPKIFFRGTKVGYIATMHHKVDVGTTVDVAYLGLGIVKPLMGVADEGKAYSFFVACTLFNEGYLFCIDVLVALDIDIVGTSNTLSQAVRRLTAAMTTAMYSFFNTMTDVFSYKNKEKTPQEKRTKKKNKIDTTF